MKTLCELPLELVMKFTSSEYEVINENLFNDERNRQIYLRLKEYYSKGQKRDYVLIASKLKGITGEHLRRLSLSVNPENSKKYVTELIEHRKRETLTKIMIDGVDDINENDPDLAATMITGKINSAIDLKKDENPHISENAIPTLNFIKRAMETKGLTGIDTGFDDLNHISGGWQKTDQIILAARPGMGKTTMAVNHALSAAKSGKNVAFFSLEMSKVQLTSLFLAIITGIDTEKMRNGNLTEKEFDKIAEAMSKLNKLPIFIYEMIPELEKITALTRLLNRKVGVDLLIVDYIQMMTSISADGKNRNSELEYISRRLKQLAKTDDVDCSNILLAQLNRGVESRSDKRPMISDLRDSGGIESDADMIIFMYRDSYYNTDSPTDETEYIIRKNRMGRLATLFRYYDNRSFSENNPNSDDGFINPDIDVNVNEFIERDSDDVPF